MSEQEQAIEEDLEECTRCESKVGSETLIRFSDWKVCETCWDDI